MGCWERCLWCGVSAGMRDGLLEVVVVVVERVGLEGLDER